MDELRGRLPVKPEVGELEQSQVFHFSLNTTREGPQEEGGESLLFVDSAPVLSLLFPLPALPK